MTSQNKNSLSKSQLKEIFQKYDVNNDNKLEFSELKNLVTDVFKETRQQQTISEEDEKAISKTVNDIISKRDIDNNKTLDWEEFSSYYMAELMENSRSLVYTSRVAAVMRNLPKIMANSRPLAYASEVGESVRPITSRKFVRFMYGLSWAYVILDTGIKTYGMKKHGREAMMYCCLDTSIFHTFASMALPAFTIHSIVKYSGKVFKKALGTESKVGKWLPVICGLGSIPFIIHPLDHFTEFVMDKSIRKIYGHKIPGLNEKSGHH